LHAAIIRCLQDHERIAAAAAFAAGCLGGGEREDRTCHWQLPSWMVMTNLMATVWQKKGWTREKERGNLLMGLFFSCCLSLLFFLFLFFNVGPLISYQDKVNCWTGFSWKISLSVVQIRWSINYLLS
jgi:hypothetical protein